MFSNQLLKFKFHTLTKTPSQLSLENEYYPSRRRNSPAIRQNLKFASDQHAKSTLKCIDDIPGPVCLPYIGTAWMYSFLGPYNRHTFHIADQDLYHKYGPIYKERRGGTTLVSLHRPSDIEKIFRNEGSRPYRVVNEALVWKRRQNPQVYPTVGLAESLGDEWHSLRTKVSPALLRPQQTQYLLSHVNQVAGELLAAFKRLVRDGNSVVLDDISAWMVRYGAEAIWRTTLGTRLGALQHHPPEEATRLALLARQQFQLMADIRLGSTLWKSWPSLFPKYRKFAAVDDAVVRLSSKHILEARARLESNSTRPCLASTVLEKFADIEALDTRDANTVIIDSFSAGVTTTASSLVLLLHRLGQERQVVTRLQEELGSVLCSPDADLTQDAIDAAPYLRAVVMEGHRLAPIIPSVIRILHKDIEISGYNIPAYTPLIAKTRASCRDERHFERALEFIPERWLPDRLAKDTEFASLTRQAKRNHFLVKPFGFGARMCVGKRLAEYEIYAALAKILVNFDLSSTGDIKLGNFLFLAPLSPVSLTLSLRARAPQ